MTVIHTPRAGEAAAAPPSAPRTIRPEVEDQPTEVLFPEAKRRGRRRRWIIGLSIVVLVAAATGLGVALSGNGSSKHEMRASPSDSYLHAFLTRAQRALNTDFQATYTTDLEEITGPPKVERVAIVQRSSAQFMYANSFPDGLETAFFSYPVGIPRVIGKFLYICSRDFVPATSWTCRPVAGGMSGSMQMSSYLPTAAVDTLEFAIFLHEHPASVQQTLGTVRSLPAFRTVKVDGAMKLSCVSFGSASWQWATICLNQAGVLGYVASRPQLSSELDGTTTLRSFSPHVSTRSLSLPAVPQTP
jgi:hypothetical protein